MADTSSEPKCNYSIDVGADAELALLLVRAATAGRDATGAPVCPGRHAGRPARGLGGEDVALVLDLGGLAGSPRRS